MRPSNSEVYFAFVVTTLMPQIMTPFLLLVSLLSYDKGSLERKLQERGVGAITIEKPTIVAD